MSTMPAATNDERRERRVEGLGVGHPAVERVLAREHVAEGVGGRQRHRRGADDRGVEQNDREERPGAVAEVVLETRGDPRGVGEVAEAACAAKANGRGGDDQTSRRRP